MGNCVSCSEGWWRRRGTGCGLTATEMMYTKPSGLYPSCPWDAKHVRRLILRGELAPRFPGREVDDTRMTGVMQTTRAVEKNDAQKHDAQKKKEEPSEGKEEEEEEEEEGEEGKETKKEEEPHQDEPNEEEQKKKKKKKKKDVVEEEEDKEKDKEKEREEEEEEEEEEEAWDEECPICMLSYPALNRTRCCAGKLCTECYLQIRPPRHHKEPCPFCKQRRFDVVYHGLVESGSKHGNHTQT